MNFSPTAFMGVALGSYSDASPTPLSSALNPFANRIIALHLLQAGHGHSLYLEDVGPQHLLEKLN